MNQESEQTAIAKEPVLNPCKAIPFTNEGVETINLFLANLEEFQRFVSETTRQKALFITLFGDILGEQERSIFNSSREFGGWFLDLSFPKQIKVLNNMGMAIPEYPKIENWEAIKAEQLEKNVAVEDWDEIDVRDFLTDEGSLWKLYPHRLIWINKFLLFANNNSISESPFDVVSHEIEIYALLQRIIRYRNSKASCFGVLANWKILWNLHLQSQERQQLIEFLKTY